MLLDQSLVLIHFDLTGTFKTVSHKTLCPSLQALELPRGVVRSKELEGTYINSMQTLHWYPTGLGTWSSSVYSIHPLMFLHRSCHRWELICWNNIPTMLGSCTCLETAMGLQLWDCTICHITQSQNSFRLSISPSFINLAQSCRFLVVLELLPGRPSPAHQLIQNAVTYSQVFLHTIVVFPPCCQLHEL